MQIVELLREAREIADAVVIAVGEGLDMKLIDDGVLEPQLAGVERGKGFDVGQHVHPGLHHARQRKSSAGSRSGAIRSRTPPHSMVWRVPVLRFSISRTRWRAPGGPISISPK